MASTLLLEHRARPRGRPARRLAVVRDLAIVAVCLAIVVGVLSRAWGLRASRPAEHPAAAATARP
jgi:hypothetical protein